MRTLVVHCHPDPQSFTSAARDRAVDALRAGGHDVRVTDLYAAGFDPVFSAEERERHLEPGPDPSVADHAADLQWCQQLVLVYPTWWSGQPAMLKGWVDRVWVRDVVWDLPPESNRVHARLRNVRRIVAITTHGSTKLVNALEGEVGKRMVTRTLRVVCHPLTRTTWVAMYGVDTANDAARQAFLDKIERKLRVNTARLRRLREELIEVGLELDIDTDLGLMVITEIDYALRPNVHERRVPSVGAFIEPTTPPETWQIGTQLEVTRRPVEAMPLSGTRLFADGLSSWLIRWVSGEDEWAVFDRPAGSERDLVVMAEAMGAVVVQRHPSGSVRVVGDFGVLRWEGLTWHKEPPTGAWIDSVSVCGVQGDREVVEILLEFAVHDLGARGIGALLVYRPDDDPGPTFEVRLPTPPALDVRRPFDLAPLRHALSQVDGAAVFDADGVLRELGVRLVPSPEAETVVEGLRGMRHTSGRRYSFDDTTATVIVVSEDGPVTVLRHGHVLGTSPTGTHG